MSSRRLRRKFTCIHSDLWYNRIHLDTGYNPVLFPGFTIYILPLPTEACGCDRQSEHIRSGM